MIGTSVVRPTLLYIWGLKNIELLWSSVAKKMLIAYKREPPTEVRNSQAQLRRS